MNPQPTATNNLWVVVRPSVTSASLTSARLKQTNLSLTWPADHTGWRLQVQTNAVATGVATHWSADPGTKKSAGPAAPRAFPP